MALQKPGIRKRLEALTNVIRSVDKEDAAFDKIQKHLREVEGDPNFKEGTGFDFPTRDREFWFNCGPLSFQEDLKGKIVVLDFFTYCCINCIHILPDLASLEAKYPIESGVVVVGVHSAKFNNEKVSDNIKNAILRYNITHPVVNDPEAVLWDQLAITCWPTLVIFSPEGDLIYTIIGEGHQKELMLFVDQAVRYYRNISKLSSHPLPISLLKDSMPASKLRFPGKVCVHGSKLFVSDSGHHRILEVEIPEGRVTKVIGSGRAGLKDGPSSEACFNSPQGLVHQDVCLFVADTENHVIRKIDLTTYVVSTIVGTGSQGNDKEGGRIGVAQPICSPWDLALSRSPGSESTNLLFIAMSGSHQIWVYFFEKTKWLQGIERETGVCVRFCGSGEELNKYNSYPHKAGFAQPSGLVLSDNGFMYVADSESSTVRAVKQDSGSVTRCVGGGLDPTDLFAFGDRDGVGREVRLQHPLGVAWDSKEKVLYLADSYNHKIKVVDVTKKSCKTLAGSGTAGKKDGSFEEALFSEPGGLCVSAGGDSVYVADTNNHSIRILNTSVKSVEELHLHFGEKVDSREDLAQSVVGAAKPTKRLSKAEPSEHRSVSLSGKGSVMVHLDLKLPPEHHLTEGAPSRWQVWPESANVTSSAYSGMIRNLEEELKVEITVDLSEQETKAEAIIEAILFYCDNEGTCRSKTFAARITTEYSSSASLKETVLIFHQVHP